MLAAMQVSDLDATATAELLRAGHASPRELVDLAIGRIEHAPYFLWSISLRMFAITSA